MKLFCPPQHGSVSTMPGILIFFSKCKTFELQESISQREFSKENSLQVGQMDFPEGPCHYLRAVEMLISFVTGNKLQPAILWVWLSILSPPRQFGYQKRYFKSKFWNSFEELQTYCSSNFNMNVIHLGLSLKPWVWFSRRAWHFAFLKERPLCTRAAQNGPHFE